MTAPNTFNHAPENIRIRPASGEDLPTLGALAAELVRQHHAYDAARFVLPRNVEEGYRDWFGRELNHAAAVLLVAERTGPSQAIVGYLYGRMEGRDWNMLLDRHAALHDILVVPEARGLGAGEAMIKRFQEIARERGLPRIVLHSASPNAGAQKLFAKLGFRPTMVEMTCEIGSAREDEPS
jgi:ribosomal protein S18 acetylase RimI-like enzyme